MRRRGHAAPRRRSRRSPRPCSVDQRPGRVRLADKSTQLIVDALTRAAAEPAGLSLYAQKSEPGLFPATTVAKVAADRAKADGLLQVVQSDVRGKATREVCVLTD